MVCKGASLSYISKLPGWADEWKSIQAASSKCPSLTMTEEVLEASTEYLELEAETTIKHDYALDPSRQKIEESLARADVVGMLLK